MRGKQAERAVQLQSEPAPLTFSSCSSSLSKSLTTGLAFPRFGLFLPFPLSRPFSSFLLSLIFTLTDFATTKTKDSNEESQENLFTGSKKTVNLQMTNQMFRSTQNILGWCLFSVILSSSHPLIILVSVWTISYIVTLNRHQEGTRSHGGQLGWVLFLFPNGWTG